MTCGTKFFFEYSHSELSAATDKPPMLSGIASLFQLILGDVFLTGL
jgi:hypothetical protein